MSDAIELKSDNLSIVRVLRLYGTDKIFVTVRFMSPAYDAPKDVNIPIPDARQPKKLGALIPEFFALAGIKASFQVEYVRQIIHDALAESQKFSILLPQGFNCVDNRWVYVLGDQILNRPSDTELFAYNPIDKHPVSIEDISDESWLQWIKTFFAQGPGQTMIFMGSLVAYVTPLLHCFGFAEPVNMYVCGESGTGKTEFSKLLTNIYGFPSTDGVSLSCGKNEILEIYRLQGNDRCFLIDDLNLSSSHREKDKKKERLSELIQMTSSGGTTPADFHRNVLLITAEYLLPSASTTNRCLLASFGEPFDSVGLTWLQKNSHLYSCFLQNFLIWICQNHDEICQSLKLALSKKPTLLDYLGAHDDGKNYIGFSRVMRRCQVMNLTRMVFLQFLKEKFPEKRHSNISNWSRQGIDMSIADTLKAIRKVHFSEYMELIIETFREDPHRVVAESYVKYKDKEKKVFFRCQKVFYFRRKKLLAYLSKHLGITRNKQTVFKEFERFGLLKKKSGPLPSDILKKEGDHQKYYQLSVDALIELIQSRHPDFLTLLNSPIDELKTLTKYE